MWVCLAIVLVWVTNFSISSDAVASASASVAARSVSSASRPSSAVLTSSRSRCPRASRARARVPLRRLERPPPPAPGRSRGSCRRPAAAARTTAACWLARSVRSPVVPATSWVEAVICWVDAAICCAMAAASCACCRIVPTSSCSLATIATIERGQRVLPRSPGPARARSGRPAPPAWRPRSPSRSAAPAGSTKSRTSELLDQQRHRREQPDASGAPIGGMAARAPPPRAGRRPQRETGHHVQPHQPRLREANQVQIQDERADATSVGSGLRAELDGTLQDGGPEAAGGRADGRTEQAAGAPPSPKAALGIDLRVLKLRQLHRSRLRPAAGRTAA